MTESDRRWTAEAMRPEPGRESLDEWLARVDDVLAGGCGCECNRGGFCGRYGHAGCGGRGMSRARWLSKYTWYEGDVTITGPDQEAREAREAREASIAESGVVRWDDGETEVVGEPR